MRAPGRFATLGASGAFPQSPLDGADAGQRRRAADDLWGRCPSWSRSWGATRLRMRCGSGDHAGCKDPITGSGVGEQARSTLAARTSASARRARKVRIGEAGTGRVVSASAIRASSGDARPFAVTSPPANHRSDLLRPANHPCSRTSSLSKARPSTIQPGGPLLRRCPPRAARAMYTS